MTLENTTILTRKIELRVYDPSQVKSTWNYLRNLDKELYQVANTIVNYQYNYHCLNTIHVDDDGKLKSISAELRKEFKSKFSAEKKIETLQNKKKTSKSDFTDDDKKELSELLLKLKECNLEIKRLESIQTSLTQITKQKYNPNTSQENLTYRHISSHFPHIHATILSCLNRVINKEIRKDLPKILKGERTVRTYKRGMPIPFSMTSEYYKNMFEYRDGTIVFKWLSGLEFTPMFDWKNRKFANKLVEIRKTIDDIITKKVDTSDSKLVVDTDNNKIYLLLSLRVPMKPKVPNNGIIAGIDLGVAVPAVVALNTGESRLFIGSKEEFFNEKARRSKVRSVLQHKFKMSKSSHGRKRKLGNLNREHIRDNESNWTSNRLHKFSKVAVDFCAKNNVSCINMENLSGIGRDTPFLLKNWCYSQFQNMIEYKAKLRGIEVKYIDPAYTSVTCAVCGNVDKEQRSNQRDFICNNKDCKNFNTIVKADYNAALNVARSTEVFTNEDSFAKRTKVKSKKNELELV